MQRLKTWAAAVAIVALTGAAQAALVSNLNGTVTDTNTNLIWLQDWNVNGAQNWATQKAWAEGLTFAGSTEWELPDLTEYRALFNAYGDLGSDTLPFVDVQSNSYWSGTDEGTNAWLFVASGGSGLSPKSGAKYAVAVRDGDVAASVPEPQTLALALLALGATVVARRRRQG